MNRVYISLHRTTLYAITMAKTKRSSTAAEPPVSATYDMLDPAEVMKAMLAQKGKGKEIESGSEKSGSEDEDESQDGSEADSVNDNDEDLDGASEESEAESSRSAELRNQKRSRSTSQEVLQPVSRVASVVASRVKPDQAPDKTVNPSPFSATPKPSPAITFETLGMSKPLISALASINIKMPTEIQAACVGAIMSGRDCIGGAKTGSGKTLAFALPIVERIARDPFGVWAVVLTPTRYAPLIIISQCVYTTPLLMKQGISIPAH